ncbi:MAG: hypothetical protein J5819_00665 [Eubacterium sp.]|nr:hypothetical protein [Eubacterium sp.]
MSEFKEGFLLSRQEYGCLYPYLMKDKVRQIFWNGRGLWIEDEDRGRHLVTDRPDEHFVDRFGMIISNQCKTAFNRTHPVMEWEGDSISIQMIHESLSPHGTTILLKKKKKPVRLSAGEMVSRGICSQDDIPVIKEIIQERQSFILTGVYGSGINDVLLFMTRYFTPEERVIAICSEHTPDPAVPNPDKDITTVKARDSDNPDWLRTCLRGMVPECILGLNPGEDVVADIMQMNEQYGIQVGLMVYTGIGVDREQLAPRINNLMIMGEKGLEIIR